MTPAKPSEHLNSTQPDYQILEGTKDAILVLDEDAHIIWANAASRRMLGLHGSEPGQAGILSVLADRVLAAPGNGNKTLEFKCWLKSPGGGERGYRCSGWRAPSGRGWMLRLREASEVGDYEAIVEYTGTATILIEDDGAISVANTEFEHLSGYARTEIVGKKQISDFIASDDERQRVQGYHALRRKDPLAAPKDYSFSFVDRSGDIHTVEVTIGLIPGTARSVMSLLDVTGRNRAERALRESEERLSLAFSAANDGLVDWDVSTSTIFYSPRCFTMLGYEPGAFAPTYSTILALIHPDDRDGVEAVLTGLVTGEHDRCEMEIRMKSASGEWAYVLDRLQVVSRGADGTPLRIAGTHFDVTERKKAERELRIRDMAIASSPSAFMITDLDGRLTYVNRAALAMWGYNSITEVIGRPITEFWRDEEDVKDAFREIFNSSGHTRERIGKRRDGTTFYVMTSGSLLTNDAGAPICLVCSGIDITERKRVEQELRVRDMAITSSSSAFAIADLDGRLTYANQAFLSIWGYASDAEVIGRQVTEFWQDEGEAAAALRTLIETGRYAGERVGRRGDGAIFHVTLSADLVSDDRGEPICITASFNNITGLKQAEAEIQAHNRELSILNQIIGVSTSTTDIDETLERVLAATLTLLDLRGGGIYLIEPDKQNVRLTCAKDLPEGFPLEPCIPDITVQPYAEVLVAGKALFLDDHPRLRYPGGSDETPCPYASIPIVAHGEVIGALNVVSGEGRQFTDADRSLLTAIGRGIGVSIERTLLIQRLELAEREANLYLDILSHDIRNAENVSGLYTGLLIDMLGGEAKRYAEKLGSSIRKSIEIVRNVSTIRRIHHESAVVVPVDLDGVIRSEIEIFSRSHIHYDGTDLAVMADSLLPEVFTNLIGNAVKFGGPEVEITIRVEESGGEVVISIEDTGPGVPDEMKDTIFTRFGKKKGRKSGQGLGLSITRMLIERYGGQIRVDDRVPGRPERGAAFRFTLKKA